MGNIFKLIDVNIFVCVEGKEKNVFGRILKMIFEIVIFKKKKQIKNIFFGRIFFLDVLQIDFGVDNYDMIFFVIVRWFGDDIL